MKVLNPWQYLLAALYTWIVTSFFGATLLDVVYARLAANTFNPFETASLFSEVADFLLLIGALTVLTAIGAIGVSWSLKSARNLFIASVLCILLPLLLYSLIDLVQTKLGLNVGTWIRLLTSALSSILAFLGLRFTTG